MNQGRLYRRMEQCIISQSANTFGLVCRPSNQFLASHKLQQKACNVYVCVCVCVKGFIGFPRNHAIPYVYRGPGRAFDCRVSTSILPSAQAASMRRTSPLGQAQKVLQHRRVLRIGEGTTWRKRNTTFTTTKITTTRYQHQHQGIMPQAQVASCGDNGNGHTNSTNSNSQANIGTMAKLVLPPNPEMHFCVFLCQKMCNCPKLAKVQTKSPELL